MKPTPRSSNFWPRVIAWGAVIGSTVPGIVWQEYGHKLGFWFPCLESIAVLVVALSAVWFRAVRPLVRFLVAVAILNFTWRYLAPSLANLPAVRAVTDNASWGARLFLSRTFTLSGAILLCFTLIGSGASRHDLFLAWGNPAAPAQPTRLRWTLLGPIIIVVFALALAPYLYLTVDPNFRLIERIVRTSPWSLAVALLNAASEEFQFRSVLLAHLRNVFPPAENALLTSALFGIGHYYGQPSGPIGVAMAGFAGWIWARSMIDTRGCVWAFGIHMVQDIVIFTFLAVGAGM
jgi:membrane protease YdiL (CAAX protease family)